MENVGYASLQIIPSMKGFESKLTSGTTGPFGRAGTSGGRLFGNSAGKSITSTVSAHAKKAALVGAAVFGAAGAAAFKLTKDSIAEAREAQKVGAITAQVIKSTGGAAKVTAAQVGDLSSALSLKSGIDDEVIQRGANMLLTFKNIQNQAGKNNDIFNKSVAITQDMAAAMAGGKGGGLDLKSSSILVGKALNDPVKGLSALSRVGVQFTKQQQAQIKALVEGGDSNAAMAMNLIQTSTEWSNLLKANGGDTQKVAQILTKDLTPAQKKVYDMYAEGGHTLEAQQRILKELNSEFGGTAAAQATMGEKVSVAWGNIQEQLGTALLPLLDKLEGWFLRKGVPAIEGWVDAFQKKAVPALKDFGHWVTTKGVDKFQDFYDKAKPIVEKTLPAMKDAFDRLKPMLKKAAEFAGDMAEQFTKMPKWAQTAIVGGLLVGKAGGFKITASLLGKGLASRAAPMPVFVTNPGFGGGAGGGGIAAAGGGKLATAAKLGLGLGGLYLGGKAFKDSGIPDKISEKFFGQDPKLAKAVDGGREGMKAYLAEMKATAEYWHTFEFNADGAFNGVERAIINSTDHVKQYQRVLGQTPKQLATTFQVNGIDRAVAQADTLIARLRAAADVSRGLDNGVTYQHGGQRPGVNVNIGTVHVKDGRDLLNKSQQAALGGRRAPGP